MKKTTKFISILLVLAMMLTMAPLSLTAFAATPTPYDGVPVTPQKISSGNYARLGLTSSNWSQFKDYYAIRNAKELYGFADIVNNTLADNTINLNAVLLQDIVINANGGNTYDWRPLYGTGNERDYRGIIDGNGHYISGIYCTQVAVKVSSNNCVSGLIGEFEGTAKNLIIKDSTFAPSQHLGTYGAIGAITGYPQACTIINCRVENTKISSIDKYGQLGGIAGYGNGLGSTIKNCASINVTFSGGGYNAPISNFAPFSDCYTSASDSHTCSNISVEHKEVKATCEYPGLSNYKYCLVCGNITSGTKTETPATGHTWTPATCQAPKTCSGCGLTEGSAETHKYTTYTLSSNAMCGANAKETALCNYGCGTTDTREISGTALVHSYTYSASGNTVTAVCANGENCPNPQSTLTISAPAELYTDGTIQREATVENNLADTSVAVSEVTYSTADGSAPKTEGTYTASVTVGGATATVEFTLLNYLARVTDKDGNLVGNYKTFADAVTAAQVNNESTIVLLDDITVDETVEITSGKFTLDVNGKTLLLNNSANIYVGVEGGDVDAANVTFTDTAGGGKITGFRLIYNYATAEITGNISLITDNYSVLNYGKMIISGNAYIYGRFAVNNENLLTVNGGTVESENEGIYNGKELIINNGNLNGSYGIWNVHSGTAEIYGGNIKGREFAVVCDGKTEIYGGTFVSEATETFVVNKQSYENSDLTVYGAEFPNGIYVIETTLNDLLADGYFYRDAGNNVINIDDDTAKINGYVKVTKGADFSADAVVTVEDVVYNGEAQEPAVTVTIGSKTLTEGKDYTLTFANNINAGTATVTVKAVGQAAGGIVGGGNSNAGNSVESVYTGEITKEFTIFKADSSIDVYPEANKLTYNGEAQTLVVIGDSNDGSIVYSLDGEKYSLAPPTGTNAGEYTVYYKVEGDSNHNDSEPETVTVIIGKKPVTASATVPDRIYGDDYQVDTSKVVVTFDGIVDGDDVGYAVIDAYYHMHTVTDSAPVQVVYNVNGADAGNYQFPEYGDWMAPNYGVQATGKVLPRDIADAQITLGDVLIYNGAEQTQSIAGVTLIGKDVTYTVSGNTATNVGVYELTITGNGNFTGTKTALYEIAPDTSAIDALTVDNVKSSDKEAIEAVAKQIENAETEIADENKVNEYNQITEKCNELLGKISETEEKLEEIKGIENNFNPEKVTSDDKAAIEEKIAEIEAVNPDNLTEEQKAEYDEIKAGFEALLEEIEKAGSKVDAIGAELEMFDEERVTIFWEDEIEALKAKIDELLADENMGEAEKTKLEEYKVQCDNLIEIINTPVKYFSMHLFYLVWDALNWVADRVVSIFNPVS